MVVATSKSSRKSIGGSDNGSFAIVESSDETSNKADEKNTEAKAEEKKSNESKSTSSAAKSTTETTSTMPKTGPEDLTLMAVTLGGLTAAGSAIALKRK